jgi:hypothetical protein
MITFPLRTRTIAVWRIAPSAFLRDLKVAIEFGGDKDFREGIIVSYLSPPQTVN